MMELYNKARRSLLLAWLLDNPVLVREIRRRMRGKLFSWSLIAYVAALGGVSCVIIFVSYPLGEIPLRKMIETVGGIGRTLFNGMMVVEAFIAIAVAPMLTAGVATQEKEKDTFDFLRVTTLHERTFVLGCLLTTACFLSLIFFCTLPILALTFVFGGVSMSQILWFNTALFLVAMAVSAWGIFNSTNYSKSRSLQGTMAVVLIVAFFFMISGAFRTFGVFSPLTGHGLDNAAAGAIFFGAASLTMSLLAISASRRLYDPNNRLLNYKQYTFVWALLLAIPGGALYWMNSSWNPGAVVAVRVDNFLSTYYLLGAALLLGSVLCFAPGRIERGDEVWRIRVRFTPFRRVHEDAIFYALYAAGWIVPTWLMAQSLAPNSPSLGYVYDTMPIILAGCVEVWCLARLVNGAAETRNKAMLLIFLVLALGWVAAPLAGLFLHTVAGGPSSGLAVDVVSQVLRDLSPPAAMIAIAGNDAWKSTLLPTVIAMVVSLLVLAPTFAPWWRRRTAVSYRWDVDPRPAGGRTLYISDSVRGLDPR